MVAVPRLAQPLTLRRITVNESHSSALPATGFLRLPKVLSLIPVGRSTWWAGVKTGLYPAPVKLGARMTAWRAEDIAALIAALGAQ